MLVIMLVFVNYAHFSKKSEIILLLFTLNLVKETMQQTSKWQTHLPCLRLLTLRVNNS